MMVFKRIISSLVFLHLTVGQEQPPGVTSPIAKTCGPSSANIVCIDRYASVLPYKFFRAPSHGTTDVSFAQTIVPNDTSFRLVRSADFVLFDKQRALDILGSNPTIEVVFEVSDAVHEAPVYVPSVNKLYLSQLAPPTGFLPQLVVDLNNDPPTLSRLISDPPVYAPNGGTFHNGLVYWGASGGNNSIGGTTQRAGIRTLNPHTNKTVTLLNNYYGYFFNTVDDLVVDSTGAIWFTDPQYSWFNRLTGVPPQLRSASYRFDPSTGAVTLIDDTLVQPNGIALSPDGKHLYLGDSGAETGSIVRGGLPGSPFNETGSRAVYKFDFIDGGTHITNKRPIYYSQDWVPDGLKVAQNGYILTATGSGIDILDPTGVLILRVQTSFVVQNFAWTGSDLTTLWFVGQGGIGRINWDLKGQDLTS